MKEFLTTFAFLLAGIYPHLWGQNFSQSVAVKSFAEEVYGIYRPDQQLVNGVQYINRYPRCHGHPYFGEDQLHPGKLTLSGRNYGDLQLKYDLVAQDLELEYTNATGMTNRIIVVPDFVEEFTIGTCFFRKMAIRESVERYYQVVTMPHFTCYIHWYKKLIPVVDNLNNMNECTDADRIYWLEHEGRVDGFRNRKSYLAIFPESSRKAIRRMLSSDQFRFKSATTGELVRMLEETSQILGKEDPLE